MWAFGYDRGKALLSSLLQLSEPTQSKTRIGIFTRMFGEGGGDGEEIIIPEKQPDTLLETLNQIPLMGMYAFWLVTYWW